MQIRFFVGLIATAFLLAGAPPALGNPNPCTPETAPAGDASLIPLSLAGLGDFYILPSDGGIWQETNNWDGLQQHDGTCTHKNSGKAIPYHADDRILL